MVAEFRMIRMRECHVAMVAECRMIRMPCSYGCKMQNDKNAMSGCFIYPENCKV